MPVAKEVDVKQEVVTKEELDELRRRLEEFRNQQSNTPSGQALHGNALDRTGFHGSSSRAASFKPVRPSTTKAHSANSSAITSLLLLFTKPTFSQLGRSVTKGLRHHGLDSSSKPSCDGYEP